jgi:5-methylthioadenosine/S-adenosylhomocysteine deaminase
VNVAVGTDSYPQDMISELQFASVLGKVMDRTFDVARARDIFNAATLSGAKALGRDDLGRLAPGAKADIVIADLDKLRIGPFIDPIKALIHCGHGDVIETVIVAGRVLVERGMLKQWNEEELLQDVRASSERVWEHFGEFHSDNHPLHEAYPTAFRAWQA